MHILPLLFPRLVAQGCGPQAKVEPNRDEDGDGFDGPGGNDCNDSDPSVNPDAVELCEDGIDNDCSGDAHGCGIGGEVSLSKHADATFSGDHTTGSTISAIGDFDGDSEPDLVIGGDGGGTSGEQGVFYVVGANRTGDVSLETTAKKVVGDGLSAHGGSALSACGDLDGDGFADFAVGERGWDNGYETSAGGVFLIYGPGAGVNVIADAPVQLLGWYKDEEAGQSIACGDVTGDGGADVVIDGNELFESTAFIVSGPLTARDGAMSLENADAIFQRPAGVGTGSYQHTTVAVSDTDGDGVRDVVLGYDDDLTSDGFTAGGAVYVFLGGSQLAGGISMDSADARIDGLGDDGLGADVAGGADANGDGNEDVLIRAHGEEHAPWPSASFLVTGVADGAIRDVAAATLTDDSFDGDGEWPGMVAFAGDVDGDGVVDLISRYNGADACAVLVYGPAAGATLLHDADTRFVENLYGGVTVAGVGDTDLDGFDDILVGVGANDRAYLLRGGPGG